MEWEDAATRTNESQETCFGDTFLTILSRGGKEFTMNTRVCFSSLIISAAVFFSSAQDTAVSLTNQEPAAADSSCTVVVTATRRAQPSAWVSDDHTLIDVERSQQNSSKSAYELVQSSVPARISDNGGGTVKTISLMGAGSQRTLVLVDGKRMGTTDGDLGDLPSETIEKIEVIEGGQSAQYGMDAMGGVVNIITKRGATEKWKGNFSATAAAYEPDNNRPRLNTQGYQLSLGKKTGNVESFTAADFGRSDGRYEYNASGSTFRMGHNDFRDWGVYQKIGLTTGDLKLNTSVSLRDRNTDNPGSLVWHDTGTMKKSVGFAEVDAGWRANEVVRFKASAAVSLNNMRFEPASYNPSNHEYLSGDIEFVQEFTFGRQLITTGLQGTRQSVMSSDVGFHVTGQGGAFTSAVLQHAIGGVNLRAMPAVRFDYSSQFKGALNGRFGLMASLPTIQEVEPSVFANIGSSYRSPTFVDLYWPYGMGNPALKKENSFDVDGGIQIRTGSGKISLSNRAAVFLMRLDDMIVLDDTWKPQNLDKASIAGFKFKSEVRYSDVYNAAFDFVYNNARNGSTDNVLTYRPRYIATFTSGLSVQRLTAGFTLRYSSEQFIDAANAQLLPAAISADVNFGITLVRTGDNGSRLRLVYDALNITNQDRMMARGYPLPKREHRLSLKAGF
jgi:vitamin B12 transporter